MFSTVQFEWLVSRAIMGQDLLPHAALHLVAKTEHDLIAGGVAGESSAKLRRARAILDRFLQIISGRSRSCDQSRGE